MDENDFLLYQCYRCGRLLDKRDEDKAKKTGIVCTCGSNRYKPANICNADLLPDGNYQVSGQFGEVFIFPAKEFESQFQPLH